MSVLFASPPHQRYHELASVGVEFLNAAERGARTVVDELFLSHDQKTIRAVAERNLDGRCREAGRGVDGGVRCELNEIITQAARG